MGPTLMTRRTTAHILDPVYRCFVQIVSVVCREVICLNLGTRSQHRQTPRLESPTPPAPVGFVRRMRFGGSSPSIHRYWVLQKIGIPKDAGAWVVDSQKYNPIWHLDSAGMGFRHQFGIPVYGLGIDHKVGDALTDMGERMEETTSSKIFAADARDERKEKKKNGPARE